MSGSPYLASEDSALLRKALSSYSGRACLEIGSGNSGTLVDLARRFSLAVGTDVVKPEMQDWSERGANFVLADSASCFRPSVFDLVAFNPPYLAADIADNAVDGGRGLEVPKKFLRDALRTVSASGAVVFLLNGDAEVGDFQRICGEAGFSVKKATSERTFFEELSVYTARHR